MSFDALGDMDIQARPGQTLIMQLQHPVLLLPPLGSFLSRLFIKKLLLSHSSEAESDP